MMDNIIKKITGVRILVIGDVILDNYIYGDVDRINPEAPVPVLRVGREESRLGGAANVAANITSLGGSCTLIGQVGRDRSGEKILDLLNGAGIKSCLIEREDFKTITKTRIVARNQQVIRVDHEEPQSLDDGHIGRVKAVLESEKYDVIVISDYAKGMISGKLMDVVKAQGVKIIVDPKLPNEGNYNGAYVITPNLIESGKMCTENDLTLRGRKLAELMGSNIVITRGADGASLFTVDGAHHYVPARKREVYDVVGAGDTFVSGLSLGIAAGLDLEMACSLANTASGIAVEKIGTSTVTVKELMDSFNDMNRKLLDTEALEGVVRELKNKGKKIVFTNGCFDILHVGHTKLLKEARMHGDVLVLGLNTDESIKLLKGPDRPINNQTDRAEILSHMPYVDYIIFFDDQTPCDLISRLRPDVHVKGGDYKPDDYERMPEAEIVHGYGGRVVTVDLVKGKSTTKNIEMLRSLDLPGVKR